MIQKYYSINFWELFGNCAQDGEWSAPQKMQACVINGMTNEMLSSITNAVADDGVMCVDDVHDKLILNRGSIVQFNLRKLGYKHDICIAVQADHSLYVNSTKNAEIVA